MEKDETLMISGPLLVSLVPGVIVLLVTWLFIKIRFPLIVQILPAVLLVLAAIRVFYIGYVNIRGFEGAAYLFLSIFQICFAI
jgi:hypothetical protein